MYMAEVLLVVIYVPMNEEIEEKMLSMSHMAPHPMYIYVHLHVGQVTSHSSARCVVGTLFLVSIVMHRKTSVYQSQLCSHVVLPAREL